MGKLSVPYSPQSLQALSQSHTGLEAREKLFLSILLRGMTLKILIWQFFVCAAHSFLTDGAAENVLWVKLRLFMFNDN